MIVIGEGIAVNPVADFVVLLRNGASFTHVIVIGWVTDGTVRKGAVDSDALKSKDVVPQKSGYGEKRKFPLHASVRTNNPCVAGGLLVIPK